MCEGARRRRKDGNGRARARLSSGRLLRPSVLSVLAALALPPRHAQDTDIERSRRRLEEIRARARPAAGAAAAAAGPGARRQRRAEQPRAAAGVHPAHRERDRAADRRARRQLDRVERRADPGGGQPGRAPRRARAPAGGHLQARPALHLPGALRRRVVRRPAEPVQVPLPHQPAGPRAGGRRRAAPQPRGRPSATTILNVRDQLDRTREEREAEYAKYTDLAQRARAAAQSLQRSARSTERRLTRCRRTRPGSTACWPRSSAPAGTKPRAARPRRRAGPGSITTADLGKLDWPVEGTIVYRFGRDTLPSGGIIRWNGVGIAAAVGTPVQGGGSGQGAAGGPVRHLRPHHRPRARQRLLLGVLPPADRAAVKLGATVTKGDAIGTVGGENSDYGPHLHFEIRGENQVALDPTDWLRKREIARRAQSAAPIRSPDCTLPRASAASTRAKRSSGLGHGGMGIGDDAGAERRPARPLSSGSAASRSRIRATERRAPSGPVSGSTIANSSPP